MAETFVIIGAGHAAGQAAVSLRNEGFEGRIVMVGDEPYIPYQRPPLSKQFLKGEIGLDRVYFKPADYYEKNNVELMLNTRVEQIDRANKVLTLSDGQTLGYDKVLLATGGRVRKLAIPGHDLDGVAYLRGIDDVDAIRPYMKPGAKLCVVGGGYIGLEVAAVARKLGMDVTVLEAESRLLSRVVGPEMSEFFQDIHEQEGVKILCDHAVSSFEGDGSGGGALKKVVCSNGAEMAADLAIVGIGILPNQEIAQEADLAVDNGILVNEFCQTEDTDVFAAGDCTQHPNALLDRSLRLESVHNALEQAKTAAMAMCGRLVAYNQVPWFWSDQYDLKLQIAGLSQGYDQIVIRRSGDRKLANFYLRHGVLIAVDAVNSPQEYLASRKWIGEKAKLPADKLADPDVSVKEIAPV